MTHEIYILQASKSALISKMPSSMSLHHLPSPQATRRPSLDILAESTVAYHFCQVNRTQMTHMYDSYISLEMCCRLGFINVNGVAIIYTKKD